MPLTTLDTTAALVVIDLQKGIVGMPTVHPAGGIVGRVAQLARAFREHGWIAASLGPTILRAETAAIAAISIVLAELT